MELVFAIISITFGLTALAAVAVVIVKQKRKEKEREGDLCKRARRRKTAVPKK